MEDFEDSDMMDFEDSDYQIDKLNDDLTDMCDIVLTSDEAYVTLLTNIHSKLCENGVEIEKYDFDEITDIINQPENSYEFSLYEGEDSDDYSYVIDIYVEKHNQTYKVDTEVRYAFEDFIDDIYDEDDSNG